jgi:2-methylcitrate dehydratase PrpD
MTGQGVDIAGRLANWSSRIDASALPADVSTAAVRCLLDATGVGLAAVDRPVVVAARHLADAPGTCTLIGRRECASATGAALANATTIHALDFDDTCYAGTLHGTAVVWPAVLAAAEDAGATGAETLAGFVAGVETAYALGNDLGNSIYDRGWWTTPLLGTIGAAAGAARVLGLEQGPTRHAIALAAAQAFGSRSVMGSAAKPYLCGLAAANGLGAALAARAGIEGPGDAFASGFGLAHLTGAAEPDWRAVAALGQRFALVQPGIAFKCYPVCSSSQAAAEAVALLREEHGIDAVSVAGVHCAVTPMVTECLPFRLPTTSTEAQFSLPFAVGAMLVFGDLTPKQLGSEALADPRLRRIMEMVTMTIDPALAASEADRRDRPEASIVTISTTDGRRLIRRIDAATGMPSNPMPDAMLDAKFRQNAQPTLSLGQADALLDRVRRLRQLPSIHDLFAFRSEELHA